MNQHLKSGDLLDKEKPVFVRANDRLRAAIKTIQRDEPGLTIAEAVRRAVYEAAERRQRTKRVT